jgi:hypothetical protein
MADPKKIPSVASAIMNSEKPAHLIEKDDKEKIVCQVNLTPIRCGSCNALLAKATTGSVVGIVCHRCKTYNFIEVSK